MTNFLSEEAQERLIRANADASGGLETFAPRELGSQAVTIAAEGQELAQDENSVIIGANKIAIDCVTHIVQARRRRLHNGDKSPYFA